MAAIFNEIVIGYAGAEHSVKPTFAMINKIEQPVISGGLGISLAGLSARASRGEVAISEVARIMGYLLRSEGVDASDEDMYVEMLTSGRGSEYIEAVTTAFFPVVRPSAAESAAKGAKKK